MSGCPIETCTVRSYNIYCKRVYISTSNPHVHRTVLGDINPIDGEGMTPLHCAAQYGRPRHIILLSEGIIYITLKPFVHAGHQLNYYHLTQYIAGCDFSTVDIEMKTALHWTASNRDSACVEALLDAYPPLLNRQLESYSIFCRKAVHFFPLSTCSHCRDNTGSTLLHLTAANGSTYLVETQLRMAG